MLNPDRRSRHDGGTLDNPPEAWQRRGPMEGTVVTTGDMVWMAVQVMLVSAIAFGVLCVITSVVRFQQRTRDIEDLPLDEPVGDDGFRVLVAAALRQASRTPGSQLVAVANVPEGDKGGALLDEQRRRLVRRAAAAVRAHDTVRWIDRHHLGLLVRTPATRAESIVSRWLVALTDEEPSATSLRVGGSVCAVAKDAPDADEVIADARRALVAAGDSDSTVIRRHDSLTETAEPPRSTPLEPLAGVPEDQRHLVDPETGLLAGDQLRSTLAKQVANARRDGTPVSILCLDIEHLATYRDHFGAEGMAAVLGWIGSFLQNEIRETDLPARTEEDTLLVTMGCAPGQAETAVARLLTRSREEAIRLGESDVRLQFHVGIAGYPDHGRAAQALLANARSALAAARSDGGGTCRLYDQSMDQTEAERSAEETF